VKVIVISGARSNVGKTHLARALCALLPDAVAVKIGHHAARPGKEGILYPMGTGLSTIAADHSTARFLIIESNSILDVLTPDCAIYLDADNPKPSARTAARKADITRGQTVPPSKIEALAARLECDEGVVRKIIHLSGALID
jgi:hypothetical protein